MYKLCIPKTTREGQPCGRYLSTDARARRDLVFLTVCEIPEIEVLTLSDDLRRDEAARKRMLNACDAAILCLPDDEARHAVSLIENEDVIVLDTSTAHRTAHRLDVRLPRAFPCAATARGRRFRAHRRPRLPCERVHRAGVSAGGIGADRRPIRALSVTA